MNGFLAVKLFGKGYIIRIGSLGLALADAVTYYIGSLTNAVPGATSGNRRVYIPKGGVIKSVYLTFMNTTLGSAETSSISVRVNDTTDYLISSSVVNNSTVVRVENISMTAPVNKGDFIELKLVTPVWATNPTTICDASIYIE